MSKRQERLYSAVHELHQQHPASGVHSWTQCGRCHSHSAIGAVCADCLVQELAELSDNPYAANRYRDLLELQVELLKEMASGCARIDQENACANVHDVHEVANGWAKRWGQQDQ